MRATSWIKHLRKRRGSQIINQMARMFNFHRTSFDDIIENILSTLEPFDAKFTFPTIASVASTKPSLLKNILDRNHEIASHGYKHVKYSFLSDKEQTREFLLATQTFQQMRIPIKGFRAPYNNYNDTTFKLVEEFGFLWDGGIGYRKEHQQKKHFFDPKIDGTRFDFTSIPLHPYTDDLLIDRYHLDAKQLGRIFSDVIRKKSASKGLVMFDLHPIRIGQRKYVESLEYLLETANRMNAWVPTVSEALIYWQKHNSWPPEYDFCVLLTGDIDNFVFLDYLRRLI